MIDHNFNLKIIDFGFINDIQGIDNDCNKFINSFII